MFKVALGETAPFPVLKKKRSSKISVRQLVVSGQIKILAYLTLTKNMLKTEDNAHIKQLSFPKIMLLWQVFFIWEVNTSLDKSTCIYVKN